MVARQQSRLTGKNYIETNVKGCDAIATKSVAKKKRGTALFRSLSYSLEKGVVLVVIATGLVALYVNLVVVITWDIENKTSQHFPLSTTAATPSLSSPKKQTGDSMNLSKTTPTTSSDHLDGRQEKNIDPLLRILRHANMTINKNKDDPLYQNLYDRLPDWNQVQERFGEPKILGLDRCAAFNAMSPPKYRAMGPAGPFNSGTNFLYNLLTENCYVPPPEGRSKHSGMTGILWQVPWGKHQSPRFRESHRHKSLRKIAKSMDLEVNEYTLPIVMVRDPFIWFQSMCKVRYAAHWYHIVPDHCPNFIPNHVEREWFHKSKLELRRIYDGDVWKIDNVLEKANFTLDNTEGPIPVWVRYKSETRNHLSLAHMWLEWYEEYFSADWPRLMVRLEDLVFYPHETLRQICECYDGAVYVGDDMLSLTLESVKGGSDNIHGKAEDRSGLIDAMINHALQNRTKGMTMADYTFSTALLRDSKMRQEFGYTVP
ncbi:hypothetical protein IV203_007098 [Nitzschia inconspicua]|uniref:Sulfotransferase domain-containing protein n=1 Tax=Nitzschia inconspicua TaxID=303405 RepID=A0A9K3KEN4_9STRA|nr:hypothetical protein IV203_007098 [Nitzschia inconspicua]